MNPPEQPPPLVPPMTAADWVRLAQGFYAVFFGQLVALVALFEALIVPSLRSIQVLLSGAAVLALVTGAWRLRQVQNLGVDWHRRTRDLLIGAVAVAYFWPFFQMWLRLSNNLYFLAQGLVYAGVCFYCPTLLCSTVVPLARALGLKSLMTQAVLFGAAAFVALFLPFVYLARSLLSATWYGVDPLFTVQTLLQRTPPALLLVLLLPASLALSLAWAAKDVALRQLLAANPTKGSERAV